MIGKVNLLTLYFLLVIQQIFNWKDSKKFNLSLCCLFETLLSKKYQNPTALTMKISAPGNILHNGEKSVWEILIKVSQRWSSTAFNHQIPDPHQNMCQSCGFWSFEQKHNQTVLREDDYPREFKNVNYKLRGFLQQPVICILLSACKIYFSIQATAGPVKNRFLQLPPIISLCFCDC